MWERGRKEGEKEEVKGEGRKEGSRDRNTSVSVHSVNMSSGKHSSVTSLPISPLPLFCADLTYSCAEGPLGRKQVF